MHSTGNPNEYAILWDSGEQTVPATSDPVGVVETIAVPNVAVTTGDSIAFYGQGIPLDEAGTGSEILSYPAPTLAAVKDRPVRIVFYNLLPTGAEGDLFLPIDYSMMGSGMGPMDMALDPTDQSTVMDDMRNPLCTEKYLDPTKRDMCFTDNRATLHLHGGITL